VHSLEQEKKKKKEEFEEPEPVEPSRAQPLEETKRIQLFDKDPLKQVIISALLKPKAEAELTQFLREHSSTFAWSAKDPTGVDRSLIEQSPR